MVRSLDTLHRHTNVCKLNRNTRSELILAIKVKNRDLKDELEQALSGTKQNNTAESSFISPISKVIKIIRDIQVANEFNDDIMNDLDYIVHLLLSNHLFKPQLLNSNMEAEVNQWLKQITDSDQHQSSVYSRPGVDDNIVERVKDTEETFG